MKEIISSFEKRCKIIDTDDCITWLGNFDKKGYGRIHFTNITLKAHRVSYCISKGIDISEISDLVVMHSCDNPSCVNPKHLSAGTSLDNVADRFKKKRCAKGESNGSAKLTLEDVAKIKAEYSKKKKGFGSIALGKKFGVCHSTILRIVNGARWNEKTNL